MRLLAFLLAMALAPAAGGAQDEGIAGILSSFGYGYEVEVWINDQPLPQIEGGGSETLRIFSSDHPMKERMPPDAPAEARSMFCLRPGTNEIRVRFRRLEADRPLEVKVEIPDRADAPVVRLSSETTPRPIARSSSRSPRPGRNRARWRSATAISAEPAGRLEPCRLPVP